MPSANTGEVYRAGLPMLGARLFAAAQMLAPGGVVADIGCDHGRLAVWLALAGKAEKVIAVDSRPLPLAGAKALVRQTATAKLVACRLGDGLAALAPGEAREIVIAGLSAQSMAAILAPHAWVQSPLVHLVLVPASRHAWLRRWLYQNGFGIETEQPVLENKRCYTVISARYTGRARTPGAFFCQMGRIPESGDAPAMRAYAQARLRDLHRRARGLSGAALAVHNQLVGEVEQVCLR